MRTNLDGRELHCRTISYLALPIEQSTASGGPLIGYDSIEGYMPLLKLFICVSAMLQRRR